MDKKFFIMEDLIYNSFYKRKTGSGSAYNYDLAPLIEDFSLYNFVREGMRKRNKSSSHGGFLVITNHQYVFGYNSGFGSGSHSPSFARTMMDIKGGGKISSPRDGIYLQDLCCKNFLCARLLFEYSHQDNDNKPVYDGRLSFLVNDVGFKITLQQFEVFKKFYEEYNEEIKQIVSKVGARNFEISYCYLNEKGQLCWNNCTSLNELYEYLANNIDYEKIIEEETVIIGKSIDSLQR